MANRIVSLHAGIYGIGIHAIMLPSSGFSVAHCIYDARSVTEQNKMQLRGISCVNSLNLKKNRDESFQVQNNTT